MNDSKDSKKILIVEDDNFLSLALKKKLEQEGYNLAMATNGEEALARLKDFRPDIVLLDIIMPVKDGIGFLEDMYANHDVEKPPIFVLTNLGTGTEEEKKCKDMGVVDFLVKTDVPLNAIVKKVRKFFE